MDVKKDPGKFTLRFCMTDPRQKKAVDELNAQGRLKAQFLTNAILRYVGAENSSGVPSRAELEAIVRAHAGRKRAEKPRRCAVTGRAWAGAKHGSRYIFNGRKPQCNCRYAKSVPWVIWEQLKATEDPDGIFCGFFRYVYRSSISMEMDTPWVFEYFIET